MRKTSNSLSTQNTQQPKVFRGGEKKVMKKSLLSLALAGSMLSALAVPAFAATPSDVVGKPVQTAVEELTALGIVNGYADGTFKPDNTITRAELAKIVIVATGNQSAANLMANTAPSFKDVKKGAWYTGYINAAAAKGFIQGYNGNFRPNDTIKFEEVTAILVRALGYKDKYLSGSWPYNVLLQGDEVGLFDGVEMANGVNATRGVVAELTENSLGANLVQYDADGNVSNVQAGTPKVDQFLINKLGTSSTAVVTATALNSDKQIVLSTGTVDTATNFFITGGKKLADLLGHTVTVLKNKDGDVLAVTDAQDTKNIITATSDAVTDLATVGSFTINDGATTYNTVAGFVVYDNTDKQGNTYDLANSEEVQLLLDGDGKVQAVLVNDWDANLLLDEVVTYSTYSRITTVNGGSSKVDANTSITLDGKAATLADLKENDVINVIENSADTALKIVATRNVITGKLESVGVDNDQATVKVGGKTYDFDISATALAALDAAKIGTEYTFYLNKDGVAVYYAAPNAATTSAYGVVYDVQTGKSIIVDGEVQTGWTKVVYYSLKDQKVNTVYTKDADVTAALNESLVELSFDTDGYIDLTPTGTPAVVPHTDLNTAAGLVASAPTATKLTVGSTNYITNSNTVYLKVVLDGTDTVVSAATAAVVSEGDKVAVQSTAGVANYVVITEDGSTADLDDAQGLFVSKAAVATSATETTYTVKLSINGEVKTFNINSAAYTALTAVKNDIVTLKDTTTGNSTYETVAQIAQTAESATLTVDNTAKTVTVAGGTFVVTANTQVYLLNHDDSTLNQGTFTDLRVAADTGNYGTADGQYKVVVTGSGVSYGGINEAGVIIVVAY
jgi:hypothetical protein